MCFLTLKNDNIFSYTNTDTQHNDLLKKHNMTSFQPAIQVDYHYLFI